MIDALFTMTEVLHSNHISSSNASKTKIKEKLGIGSIY